jgi:hypothetical protein
MTTTDEDLPALIFKKVTALSSLGMARDFSKYKNAKYRKEPIGLAEAFRGTKLFEHWDVKISQARIRNNWDKILNPEFAQNLTITGFDEHVMRIEPANSTWGASLKANKVQVIKLVNEFLQMEFLTEILIKDVSVAQKKYRYAGARRRR